MAPIADSLTARSPYGEKYYVYSSCEAVFPALSTLIVCLRIYLRKTNNLALGWDDATIIAALPFVWASWATFFSIYAHVAPDGTQYIDPARIPTLLQLTLGNLEVSITAINLIKFSIIFFFIRAFGTTKKTRKCLYTMIGVNSAYGVVRFFIIFVQCIPISVFWNNPTACKGNMHTYWIVISIIGLVLELGMLAFPLPFILRVQIPLARKIGILAILVVGACVVLACVLRVWFYYQLPNMADRVFRDHEATMLHLMQELAINGGVLVACLPAMHSPLCKLFKNWRSKAVSRAGSCGPSASFAAARDDEVPRHRPQRRGLFDLTLSTWGSKDGDSEACDTIDEVASPDEGFTPVTDPEKPPTKVDVRVQETRIEE